MNVTDGSLGAWKTAASAGQIKDITCTICGCKYDPADSGHTITQADKSQPKIDALDTITGPLVGGTSIVITGHALDFGTITIRFDGVPGVNLRAQSDTSLTIDTPPAVMRLIKQKEIQRKLTITNAIGNWVVGDHITGTAKTAIIREVDSASPPTWLMVDTWTDDFQANEPLTTTGATATVVGFGTSFKANESLIGQTSGHTAIIFAEGDLRIKSRTGDFTNEEWVVGSSSGAKTQLASANHLVGPGPVNVSAENEYGQRGSGGALSKAFTYT